MAEFNWVKARFECSIKAIFKKLETGAKADIAAVSEIAQQLNSQDTFEVSAFPDRFTVIRKKLGTITAVDFSVTQTEIIATTGDETQVTLARAVPTLNADGSCLLVMEGREVELWQFRRTALERLLFTNLYTASKS